MSFKLFLATTFGLMKSTEKIESAYDSLRADYHSFVDFQKSVEFKDYHELEMLVNSPTFKQEKKHLQSLTFKGSKEAAQLDEYRKLESKGKLQRFFSTQKSEDLKRYERLLASETLANYNKLKAIVGSSSFDKQKLKDEKSDEYAKYSAYEKIKASDDMKFFGLFSKSKEYKNYLAMKDSPERRRFVELEKIINSEEYKARVIYLEDNQKWEKTEDAVKEKQFTELLGSPEVINYLKYKHSNAFDFFKKWNLVFEDRFDAGKLDTQKWMTQSYWASQALGQNFSQIGDLHAFTDGRNISVNGKSLTLEVREEKATSMQWRIPFGFVEQDFDYTSGIISTAGGEWWKHGILEAKVKYNPAQNLVDAIYLLGEQSSPQVNLIEMGEKNRIGLFSRNGDQYHGQSESLSGLKEGQFYIFRLEWSANSLVWKINNKEILTINQHVPEFKMHLNAASIIVNEPGNSLPHYFEIDWVRFYQHHK